MARSLFAIAVTAGLALVGPLPAAAEEPIEKNPAEIAREGMETLLRALDALIDSIPQYGMPEITDDGDIIIPRRDRREIEPVPPGAERIRA